MSNNKILVIYHSADMDGIFCREIAKRNFGNLADYVGWNFGQPVPNTENYEEIYLLDLSIPELMNDPRLIWIDHHKTAIDKYPTTIKGYRIDGVAACRLTYQFFFGSTNYKLDDYKNQNINYEPYAVTLVGEYDVWDKHNPDTDKFQASLRLINSTNESIYQEFLTTIYPDRLENFIRMGEIILNYKRNVDEQMVKSRGFNLMFEGINFLALVAPMINSQTFEKGLKLEHQACMAISYSKNGWMVSLYHAPGHEDIDLSVIAKKYNGGGHKGACGFTCKELPFKL